MRFAVDNMIAGEGLPDSKGSGEQRTKKRGWSAGRRGLSNDGDRQEWRQSRDRNARAIVNRHQRQRKRSEESHRVNSDTKNQPAEQADAKHIENES